MYFKRRLNNRGSYTVEASVIIPLILWILLCFILLSFFVYNRCAIDRGVHMAALRGSEAIWESNQVQVEKANRGLEDILSHHLLGDVSMNKDIISKGKKVRVLVDSSFQKWNYSSCCEKTVLNPVKFVRYCRRLGM